MADKNILYYLNPINWFKNEPPIREINMRSGNWERGLITHYYNGEKNSGDAGPLKIYGIDYLTLRWRSRQCYVESDLAQTVIGRFCTWVIGKGLRLQAEPSKKVFELEKIQIDTQKFSSDVEAYFELFCSDEETDFSGMDSLSTKANEAYKDALIGGDVLVVLRYINKQIKVQIIDGEWVQSPNYSNQEYKLENGNVICHGVEKDSFGKIIAFHVKTDDLKFERIPARVEGTDLQSAFLVTANKYRIGGSRGMPILGVILEKLTKMDRYSDAVLGSAEERAKIVMFIQHHINGTGDNPFMANVARAIDPTATAVPQTDDGKVLADNIAATTQKQVFNMPQGSELKTVSSQNDLYFQEFFTVNIHLVAAAIGMPYNIAMSKYDDNYSSSRAAIKDWENTLNVTRENFQRAFYRQIYKYWLEIMIMEGKINAPGYLQARIKNNRFILNAYRKARFVGTPVPHIDPAKEVAAERAKLGPLGAHLPLTTVEAATENLNAGESLANMEQFSKELETATKLSLNPITKEETKKEKESED